MIGCASGLGNAFRFPVLCARYGLAFVAVYALMLVVVCFPLLCAELYFGKIIHGRRGQKVWRAILRVATVNSAFIAAYYGVICAKLGSASVSFALFYGGERGETALFAVILILVTVAVFFILRRGNAVLAHTGKISVILSLATFALLAVLGFTHGNRLPQASFSCLTGGAVWADALGQALLALSLASGVMPSFSCNYGVRVLPTAISVIACNFLGCVLSALATAPYIPFISQTVGISCGLELYKSAVFALFSGKILRSVAGTAVFAVLTLVAIHSLCSLAYPLLSKLTGSKSKANSLVSAVFSLITCVLAPLFLSDNMQVLTACDQMACSVTAVTIAFAECLFFAFSKRVKRLSQGHIRGAIAFFIQFFCPVVTGALALFSLCSARFNCFTPLATATAFATATAIVLTAPLPQLTFFAKRIKMFLMRKSVEGEH